jgi:cobalt-zinc-cadmium efflux system protein
MPGFDPALGAPDRRRSREHAGSPGHAHPHVHGASAETDIGMLVVALAINAAFVVVEVVVGLLSHSLALLSDAAHMLSDAAAIALAVGAARLARRRPGGAMTFGLGRAEIVSAQINAVALIALAALIVFEGVRRLVDPPDVEAPLVLWVALAGLLANLAAAWALARANRRSLNVEGAFQHNLTDAYSSIGTAIAALVIILTGYERADAIASLLIAALMLRSGGRLLVASGRVFMEAAPVGLDPNEIGHAMVREPGIVEVHDLHVWEVTSGFPALSAHVIVRAESDCHALRRRLAEQLHDRFGIDHTTLQVDHERTTLLSIDPPEPGTPGSRAR